MSKVITTTLLALTAATLAALVIMYPIYLLGAWSWYMFTILFLGETALVYVYLAQSPDGCTSAGPSPEVGAGTDP